MRGHKHLQLIIFLNFYSDFLTIVMFDESNHKRLRNIKLFFRKNIPGQYNLPLKQNMLPSVTAGQIKSRRPPVTPVFAVCLQAGISFLPNV